MLLIGGGGRSAGQRQADHRRGAGATTCATWPARGAGARAVAAGSARRWSRASRSRAWPAVLAAGRLWERRRADPDFGACARARRRSGWPHADPPETGPVEGLEPVTALALRRFLRGARGRPRPAGRAVAAGDGAIWLDAPDARPSRPRAGPGRSSRSTCCGTARPTRGSPWSPHRRTGAGVGVGQVAAAHRPPAAARRRGPAADVHGAADDVRRAWEAELAGRAPGAAATEPHLLVVVDGVATGPARGPVAPSVTVLRVGAPPGGGRRRPWCACSCGPVDASWTDGGTASRRCRRPPGRGCRRRRPRRWPAGSPATGPRGPPPRPSRAPRRGPARAARPAAGARPVAIGASARCAWQPPAAADRLRVPIGVDERGGAGRRWTSRSPPRAAAGRTGSASAPPDRARASCCAPSCSAWWPRTRSEG